MIILCAMENEAKYIDVPNAKVIVTGIGAGNVIKTLSKALLNNEIKLDDFIINVGYAGSSLFNIGEVVAVCFSEPYVHKFNEQIFKINHLKIENLSGCCSAGDFINNEFCPLVDMELYYILAFGFTNIMSFKIVSDKLNYNEYEKFEPKKSWDKLNKLIKENLNG